MNRNFLLVFLIFQFTFWWNTKAIKPDMHILPEVPSKEAVKANSLGDEELYFRILTLELQNAGDTFGRFTPLKNYNYKKLSEWLFLLDTLDSKANFVPAIASYYYSQTQNTPDVRYIVDYLDSHASKDLANKWWWMTQAVYLANNKLNDNELALKLSYKLTNIPGKIPMWVREMPAFIHEKRGEKAEALNIIKNIIDNYQSDELTIDELNFIHYFIKERIEKMKEDIK